jgi:hypothetical protein
VSNEGGHATAAIEIGECFDNRSALRFGPGETHGILQLPVGNINRGFHASFLLQKEFQGKSLG